MNDDPELVEMKQRANTRSLKEMALLLRYISTPYSLIIFWDMDTELLGDCFFLYLRSRKADSNHKRSEVHFMALRSECD